MAIWRLLRIGKELIGRKHVSEMPVLRPLELKHIGKQK